MTEEYIKRSDLPAKKRWNMFLEQEYFNEGWNACLEEIKKIPSVKGRVVGQGRWEHHLIDCSNLFTNYCTECGSYLPYGMDWEPNYCPMCGSYNGGDNDEQRD